MEAYWDSECGYGLTGAGCPEERTRIYLHSVQFISELIFSSTPQAYESYNLPLLQTFRNLLEAVFRDPSGRLIRICRARKGGYRILSNTTITFPPCKVEHRRRNFMGMFGDVQEIAEVVAIRRNRRGELAIGRLIESNIGVDDVIGEFSLALEDLDGEAEDPPVYNQLRSFASGLAKRDQAVFNRIRSLVIVASPPLENLRFFNKCTELETLEFIGHCPHRASPLLPFFTELTSSGHMPKLESYNITYSASGGTYSLSAPEEAVDFQAAIRRALPKLWAVTFELKFDEEEADEDGLFDAFQAYVQAYLGEEWEGSRLTEEEMERGEVVPNLSFEKKREDRDILGAVAAGDGTGTPGWRLIEQTGV